MSMTTTELIELLKGVEHGGATLQPRVISLHVNDEYIPNPNISILSTGDGMLGAQLSLRVEGESERTCSNQSKGGHSMKYRLIYVDLRGMRNVLTETATDDDINIFLESGSDVTRITEDTTGRTEIEMSSGVVYIYEPIGEVEGTVYEYKERILSELPADTRYWEGSAIEKELDEVYDKAKAWNDFEEYFDSVVSEEGYVGDTDENIVSTIQNIRMNYQEYRRGKGAME